MARNKKHPKDPEYEAALKVVLERAFYVIQKLEKKTGRWTTVGGAIKGHPAALKQLDKMKKDDTYSYKWRTVMEPIAQAYASGWNAREDLADGKWDPYDSSNDASSGMKNRHSSSLAWTSG